MKGSLELEFGEAFQLHEVAQAMNWGQQQEPLILLQAAVDTVRVCD